jgi:SAM-dependent methyltransferase
VSAHPTWLEALLRDGDPGGSPEAFDAGRFEGLYGGLYDRVIQSPAFRRFAPLAYGEAGPLVDLGGFAARAAASVREGGVVLDVPSGGGTLLPLLARGGLRGRVIESDLGAAMLERAERMAARVPELDVALLRADAQDLPLKDATIAAAVSLNGLHCIPDPRAFCRELGRVIEPGGRLWMITLVRGGTRRADAVIVGARALGIIPGPLPDRDALEAMVHDAGFEAVEHLGGEGLLGLAATRA